MAKLEVIKQDAMYLFRFNMSDGRVIEKQYSEESHNAMRDYFKPIDIKEEKNIPEFDELWKLHPKGNKKTAKQRFTRAIKLITFAELKSKLEPYIKSNDFCYLKGLDVWLNPEKEYWNDMIVKKEDKFKKEEPAKKGFFEQ